MTTTIIIIIIIIKIIIVIYCLVQYFGFKDLWHGVSPRWCGFQVIWITSPPYSPEGLGNTIFCTKCVGEFAVSVCSKFDILRHHDDETES